MEGKEGETLKACWYRSLNVVSPWFGLGKQPRLITAIPASPSYGPASLAQATLPEVYSLLLL
jgi:hypothetical protein